MDIRVESGRRSPVALPDGLRNRWSAEETAQVRQVFPQNDGWIVAWNHGEFGGGLEWYPRSDGGAQPIVVGSDEDVQNVNLGRVENGALYVLQGISHLTLSEGQLAKVWRDHGRFQSHVIARYTTEPVDWIRERDGAWLVLTWDAIWRTSEKGTSDLVARLPKALNNPNSLVEAPDGTVYVGASSGVLRLTPTWPDVPRYAADFLLPKGSRYEACWQRATSAPARAP